MTVKTYGKQEPGEQRSEAMEMTTFFGVLKRKYPHIAPLAVHIRNEGKRDHKETLAMKIQGGFVKGASDIIIIGVPPFVCEMKSKSKDSRLIQEQKVFLDNADKAGAFACIAYGYEAAIEAVNDWIKEKPL